MSNIRYLFVCKIEATQTSIQYYAVKETSQQLVISLQHMLIKIISYDELTPINKTDTSMHNPYYGIPNRNKNNYMAHKNEMERNFLPSVRAFVFWVLVNTAFSKASFALFVGQSSE